MTDTATTTQLAAIAAYGLAGTFHTLPDRPLDDVAWADLRTHAREQRLTGLLNAAIDDFALPVTDEQREEALDDQTAAMAGALVLEDLLLSVVDDLNAAGIPSRVLKGCAVSHLDYRSPDHRIFGDLDLLVPSSHFDSAVELLARSGYVRPFTPPRPGWERRFGKGASFRAGDGREIDLHRTFCTGPMSVRMRLADIWSEPAEVYSLGGRALEALSRELRLMNAAYAAVLGDKVPPLPTLRDIAELALHPHLDTTQLLELARGWGGEAVLAAAMRSAWSELAIGDVTALSTWADHYRPSAAETRTLALYHTEGVTETARALATAQAIPNVLTRATYLWGLARANPQFASRSKRGPVQRVTHAVSSLRRIRREA
jgi:hypothetical protein